MIIYYLRNLLIMLNELPLYQFNRSETVFIKDVSRVKLETLLDIFGDRKVPHMGNYAFI